eukprot:1194907-Prorocentrum_minimum.AAC.3
MCEIIHANGRSTCGYGAPWRELSGRIVSTLDKQAHFDTHHPTPDARKARMPVAGMAESLLLRQQFTRSLTTGTRSVAISLLPLICYGTKFRKLLLETPMKTELGWQGRKGRLKRPKSSKMHSPALQPTCSTPHPYYLSMQA